MISPLLLAALNDDATSRNTKGSDMISCHWNVLFIKSCMHCKAAGYENFRTIEKDAATYTRSHDIYHVSALNRCITPTAGGQEVII